MIGNCGFKNCKMQEMFDSLWKLIRQKYFEFNGFTTGQITCGEKCAGASCFLTPKKGSKEKILFPPEVVSFPQLGFLFGTT